MRCAATRRRAPSERTPNTEFPGGHRIRVTPVPIPNTEVKPDTADGTACAGVWESRSLPGISSSRTSHQGRSRTRHEAAVSHHSGLFLCTVLVPAGDSQRRLLRCHLEFVLVVFLVLFVFIIL